MSDIEILSRLIHITKAELPQNAEVELVEYKKGIECSWPLTDDKKRPHKMTQTILIKLHSSFDTSEFSQNPFDIISEEFTTFIRNKRRQFIPNPAKNNEELPPEELWVFPAEC